jgi:hypothetical protein
MAITLEAYRRGAETGRLAAGVTCLASGSPG